MPLHPGASLVCFPRPKISPALCKQECGEHCNISRGGCRDFPAFLENSALTLGRRGVNFASRIFCHSIPQDTEGFAPKLDVPLSREVLVYSLVE